MRNNSDLDLSAATWYKSSYSGGSGDDCLEVADGLITRYADYTDPRPFIKT